MPAMVASSAGSTIATSSTSTPAARRGCPTAMAADRGIDQQPAGHQRQHDQTDQRRRAQGRQRPARRAGSCRRRAGRRRSRAPRPAPGPAGRACQGDRRRARAAGDSGQRVQHALVQRSSQCLITGAARGFGLLRKFFGGSRGRIGLEGMAGFRGRTRDSAQPPPLPAILRNDYSALRTGRGAGDGYARRSLSSPPEPCP